MSESGKDFPDWENLYKSQKIETMPWYNENFDSDLEKELDDIRLQWIRYILQVFKELSIFSFGISILWINRQINLSKSRKESNPASSASCAK
jgi:hypothetical protein